MSDGTKDDPVMVPEFDRAEHAPIEPDVPVAADVPRQMAKERSDAPALRKLGDRDRGGDVYWQEQGVSSVRTWPWWMGDNDVNNLLMAVGSIWEDMWEVMSQGRKQTLDEPGTIVLSQLQLESGPPAVNWVPRADVRDRLLPVLATIGTPNYDPVHDIHVTLVLDRQLGREFHPDAPLHVVIVDNARLDDKD